MPTIYQLPIQQPAMVGVFPNQKFAVFGDNLATITTAGYLNQVNLESNPISATDVLQVLYSFNNVSKTGTYGVFTVTISNSGVITLVEWTGTTGIVLPTIANHLATYTNTTGTLSEDPATAISGGNIQAGLSGTAGKLTSFPATAAEGSLSLAAVNNTGGNFATTISNAASVGQNQAVSIPDLGAATGAFITSSATAMQTISSPLQVTSSLSGTTIDATTGVLVSGSSGVAGDLTLYPPTASRGTVVISAVNNTGNTVTTITNAAMGQASVISIPDPGAATANFLLNSGANIMAAGSSIILAKVNGTEAANAVTASGNAGVITTSSLSTAGGASYAITWTNTLITTSSVILLTIMGGTNTTENITLKATAGAGTSTLTIYNNTAATSLNGTILIGYTVL